MECKSAEKEADVIVCQTKASVFKSSYLLLNSSMKRLVSTLSALLKYCSSHPTLEVESQQNHIISQLMHLRFEKWAFISNPTKPEHSVVTLNLKASILSPPNNDGLIPTGYQLQK